MSYNDLTVIITSFKSEKKIIPCLESINSKLKVIVVENSNDKDLANKIEKKFENVECVLSKENLGYAKGNNLGLSMVKTKFALIINPDAVLQDSSIENFFKSAKTNPEFAIISPLIQELNNKIDKIIPKNGNLLEVNNVKGFAMFLNMSEFKDVGFFDDNFFIYFEEIDLCTRLKNKNKKIYLDQTIKILHLGASSHDASIDYEMELSRNWHWMWSTFYYHYKHDGYFYSLYKIFPKFFSAFLKIIFYSLSFDKTKKMIYLHRFLGILNSILLKESWYRPKILNN